MGTRKGFRPIRRQEHKQASPPSVPSLEVTLALDCFGYVSFKFDFC